MAKAINVQASGVVVGKWQYQGNMYLRILSRRQRNIPYPDNKKFDVYTVRINYFLHQDDDHDLPDRQDIVRIEGFLQQYDKQVSLANLLRHKLQEDASDPQALKALKKMDDQANRIQFREDKVEIVALDWEIIRRKNQRRRRKAKAKQTQGGGNQGQEKKPEAKSGKKESKAKKPKAKAKAEVKAEAQEKPKKPQEKPDAQEKEDGEKDTA